MREASKRLAESLFDSYENDWAGEEDLGAIVEVSVVLRVSFCCVATKATGLTGDTNLRLYTALMHNKHSINAALFNKGEDLLWADYEVKLVDQAVRTVESYVSQFPDARVRRQAASEQKSVMESKQAPRRRPVRRRKFPKGEENWSTTTRRATTWRRCRPPRNGTTSRSRRFGTDGQRCPVLLSRHFASSTVSSPL